MQFRADCSGCQFFGFRVFVVAVRVWGDRHCLALSRPAAARKISERAHSFSCVSVCVLVFLNFFAQVSAGFRLVA